MLTCGTLPFEKQIARYKLLSNLIYKYFSCITPFFASDWNESILYCRSLLWNIHCLSIFLCLDDEHVLL